MTRLRRTIATRLKEAQNTAAMLTTFNEVDMSAAMALRSEYKDAFEKKHGGARLGFMGFFVRACVTALVRSSPPSTPRSTAMRSSTSTSSTWASRSAGRTAWWCRWCAMPTR